MHRDNHICLDCRVTFKSNWTCPNCGKTLIDVSHKTRVPGKKKVKEWNKFIKWLSGRNLYIAEEISDFRRGNA